MFGSRHRKIIAAFEADRSPSETRAACSRAAAPRFTQHLENRVPLNAKLVGPARQEAHFTRVPHKPLMHPTSREKPRDPYRHAQEHKRSHFALKRDRNDAD